MTDTQEYLALPHTRYLPEIWPSPTCNLPRLPLLLGTSS